MPAKAEAEKKRKALDDAAAAARLDLLECPVCNDYMSGAIFQCPNQHIICVTCKGKLPLPKQCPQCKHTDLNARSRILELLAKSMAVACPLPGCTEAVMVSQLQAHKEACMHAPIKCGKLVIRDIRCDFQANSGDEFLAHLQAAHGGNVTIHGVWEGLGISSTLITTGRPREHDDEAFNEDPVVQDLDWLHVLRTSKETYIVSVRRSAEELGMGRFRFYVLQLAGPGVSVERKVTLQFVGPETGAAKSAKTEAEVCVMNYRAPFEELWEHFESDDMPAELEGELTDRQALKLFGHTGRMLVDALPQDFCICFRCIIE